MWLKVLQLCILSLIVQSLKGERLEWTICPTSFPTFPLLVKNNTGIRPDSLAKFWERMSGKEDIFNNSFNSGINVRFHNNFLFQLCKNILFKRFHWKSYHIQRYESIDWCLIKDELWIFFSPKTSTENQRSPNKLKAWTDTHSGPITPR